MLSTVEKEIRRIVFHGVFTWHNIQILAFRRNAALEHSHVPWPRCYDCSWAGSAVWSCCHGATGPTASYFYHLDLYRKDRHPSVEMAKFHTLHSVVKQSTQRGPTKPVGRTGLLLRAPSLTPRLIRTSGQDSLGIHTSSKYISRRIYNIDMIQIAGRVL